VMPKGCIFADKGPVTFVEGDNDQELEVRPRIQTSA
jgi:hypothetical protein